MNTQTMLEKAKALEPELIRTAVKPQRVVKVSMGQEDWEAEAQGSYEELVQGKAFAQGESFVLDFGNHHVGYVTLKLSSVGHHQDAPAFLRVKFGEHLCEMGANFSEYTGSLGCGWLQEEFMHIDVLPAVIRMPRRYAFRYMEFHVKGASGAFKVVVDDISCEAVSSADMSKVAPLTGADEELAAIDRVSLKTLQDCMHSVFEDGPKRDRRLWLGDLRLQALTNYETFRNFDLVKRCLYLFAGVPQANGQMCSCLFLEPEVEADHLHLLDYSLFFLSTLYDYYKASGDKETLSELWDTAYRQIEIAWELVGENGVLRDSQTWWCFLDWKRGLNKQAGAQAVYIYAMKQAIELAKELGDTARLQQMKPMLQTLVDAALTQLWDEEQGFFVSGADRQVSWASQVWFVLAGIFDQERSAKLLRHLAEVNPEMDMVTPYMHHHYVEALWQCGMKQEAEDHLRRYWGSMVKLGADCFYEIYDMHDKNASYSASRISNSYCHAWSSTPSYFIRKYFLA